MKALILPTLLSLALFGCGADEATTPPEAPAIADGGEPLKPCEPGSTDPTDSTTTQPDYQREQRMALEIRDAILDGEPVDLKAGDHEFMAIDMAAEADSPKGAVIILHGRGFHPDWEDTIYPLRTGLTQHGWRTLSLQMPVLEKTAKYYDYVPLFPASWPRIEAAIDHLKSEGIDNIVLFAHSCGAHMAMTWIAANGDEKINAYIGAGMGATDYQQPMKEPFPLADMKVPVLDVYGAEEYPAVLKMAPERLAMIQQAGNPKSAQTIVPDADHYFTDAGDGLVKAVSDWLATLE